MRRAASLLLLLLSACEPPPPPPPPPPPAPPPAAPEPPLPPTADLSFPAWEEVEEERFLELPGAPAAPLRWSFPAGRRFGYDYDQNVRQTTTATQGERSGTMSGRDRNGGGFDVRGKGGAADVLVTIESREAFRDDRAVSIEELRQKGPSRFQVELREDGTVNLGRLDKGSDAALLFDLLLALGEGARALESGATLTTRWAGRRKIGRHECARIETEIELDGPVPGGRRRLRGRAVGHFDPAEGRFVRASAVLAASQRENVKDPAGAWATRAVDSRTSFRIKLLE